ncbi:oleosin 5-like, partial [Asparagus officinalis]|uniref:oleosin 5-like n=1 Tax=Asparagus officinalis TaxID=4686 RepID=UPI00098DEC96
ALLPVGGILLALSGFTLLGTVVSLAITTPLFVIFSPVLVPAAITIGLAVTGFLASGAFGVMALTAMSWIWSYVTRGRRVPEQVEHVKRRMGEVVMEVPEQKKLIEINRKAFWWLQT